MKPSFFSLRLCVFALMLAVISSQAARAETVTSPDLVWVEPQSRADLAQLKAEIEHGGGKVLGLAPEGRLLVRFKKGDRDKIAKTPGIAATHAHRKAVEKDQPAGRGMGLKRKKDGKSRPGVTQLTSVEPNMLSIARAQLEGTSSPTAVDNSTSMYFPPIRSQGGLGSCVAWACGYYLQTYTQAKDENLDVSTGNNDLICSPAWAYNLCNDGADDGTSSDKVLTRLNKSGACSWNMMPYTTNYWSWPTEAAWIEALSRRTDATYSIGQVDGTTTDADIAAIKQLLANGTIVVTETDVYSNWADNYPYNQSGINNGVLFAVAGNYYGDHQMTVVGYDDNKSYFDGTTTKYGAFLLANSWGNWGTTNTAGATGFMWVSYDFFQHTGYCFGQVMYNTDRPHYRSQLYATVGIDHNTRGSVILKGGVGTGSWTGVNVLDCDGGITLPINSASRVVVDLTEGIGQIALPWLDLNVQMYIFPFNNYNGTIAGATFYEDLDGDGAFQSFDATNTPVTVAPYDWGTASMHYALTDGSIDHFAFGPIGPQTAGQPFPATVTALDLNNEPAAGFSGPANLSVCAETTITVGDGTHDSSVPFYIGYCISRAQTIYLQSELASTTTTLNAITYDIDTPPGMPMQYLPLTNLTIRMKHTTLLYYGQGAWEGPNSGWTTVYRGTTTIDHTGRFRITFETPFVYNGRDNLMIDVSFMNPSGYIGGYTHNMYTSYPRTLCKQINVAPDPLTWEGPVSSYYYYYQIPNIQLFTYVNIPVTPAVIDSFTSGTWTGLASISGTGPVCLKAGDSAGHVGLSNWFTVSAPGSLAVTISPAEAIGLGAQWRRSGNEAWRASGFTESGLALGGYTVEFMQIPGWTTPSSQTATITSNHTSTITGVYERMAEVWTDFSYAGTVFGTETQPFKTLTDAVGAVASGGVVKIKAGSRTEPIRITKPVRLEAIGGAARIAGGGS